MNKKILIAIGITGCVAAYAAKKDPVVMTINGIDVPKSEFEYLYHKNSRQQLESQSLDEYADMFKLYKMKVQDALTEGIDTTAAFKNELTGYRNELATPYLVDSTYVNNLVKEAYDRLGKEVEVSHIMLFKGGGQAGDYEIRERMDSIDKALKGGADFAELANKVSQDRRSADKGGNMGYITALMYPYDFETAAYNLADGATSGIVESPVGLHIIKRGHSRPARGTVLVKHILKLVPADASDEQKTAIKNQIDSIYNAVIAGADFDALARQYSQDPGSAAQGGALPWFGVGRMVPEFENTSFALAKDEISAPVKTQFGWHIIKKIDERGIDSYDQMRPRILKFINSTQDGRRQHIYENFVSKLQKRYKFKENKAIIKQMTDYIAANGCDSTFYDNFLRSDIGKTTLISFADTSCNVADMLAGMSRYLNDNPKPALNFFNTRLKRFEQSALFSYAQANLENEYPDFRNLINEYRDGMLLFEVSNRKVWDKASQDTIGLNKFFADHRNDYTWKVPHVKGFLVQATNDSVANAARQFMATIPADDILNSVRKEFGDNIKIDRILRAKGENALIDGLAFGEGAVLPTNSRYPVCYLYDFKIISAPEEATDVRGPVTSDYQNELEQRWIEELKAKYPVTVNDKELKKIK